MIMNLILTIGSIWLILIFWVTVQTTYKKKMNRPSIATCSSGGGCGNCTGDSSCSTTN